MITVISIVIIIITITIINVTIIISTNIMTIELSVIIITRSELATSVSSGVSKRGPDLGSCDVRRRHADSFERACAFGLEIRV